MTKRFGLTKKVLLACGSMVRADRLCAVFSARSAEKTAHSKMESTALPKAQHANCVNPIFLSVVFRP
jgi:hypothetical protein